MHSHPFFYMYYLYRPVNLNNVVIPECLCQESSDFTAFRVDGSLV